MLTRKDYVAIAQIVANTPYQTDILGVELIKKTALISKLADYCQADNPNFNRDKFGNACYE